MKGGVYRMLTKDQAKPDGEKRCRGNGDQPPAALQHRAVGNRPRGGEIHRFSKEQRGGSERSV